MKKLLISITALVIIFGGLLVFAQHVQAPTKPVEKTTPPSKSKTVIKPFDKTQYSIDDPASIWVVVNKKRPLNPTAYSPTDLVVPAVPLRSGSGSSEMQLRQVTASALQEMAAAAKAENANLMLASGYRSYALQVSVYNAEVQNNGQATADSESARPGHSEHQTGLAADLEPASRQCEIDTCFADTAEGKWLAANAYKYGFIIRYPADKQPVTGYKYEPWHVRFIGKELALEMHNKSITTLEEFFSLPAAPSY